MHAFFPPAAFSDSVESRQRKILEGYTAGKAWFALDCLILGDIALAPVVKRCLEFQIEHPELPEITRWMKAIKVPH